MHASRTLNSGADERASSSSVIGAFFYIDYAEPTEASDSGKAIITAMETKWLEDFVSLAETRSFAASPNCAM